MRCLPLPTPSFTHPIPTTWQGLLCGLGEEMARLRGTGHQIFCEFWETHSSRQGSGTWNPSKSGFRWFCLSPKLASLGAVRCLHALNTSDAASYSLVFLFRKAR